MAATKKGAKKKPVTAKKKGPTARQKRALGQAYDELDQAEYNAADLVSSLSRVEKLMEIAGPGFPGVSKKVMAAINAVNDAIDDLAFLSDEIEEVDDLPWRVGKPLVKE